MATDNVTSIDTALAIKRREIDQINTIIARAAADGWTIVRKRADSRYFTATKQFGTVYHTMSVWVRNGRFGCSRSQTMTTEKLSYAADWVTLP